MGVIGKTFAILMLPIGVLILLEKLGIFTLVLPIEVNKVFIGALLMTVLELITLGMVLKEHKSLSVMNVVIAAVFIGTAIAASGSQLLGFLEKELAIMLGVMMLIEALYALH